MRTQSYEELMGKQACNNEYKWTNPLHKNMIILWVEKVKAKHIFSYNYNSLFVYICYKIYFILKLFCSFMYYCTTGHLKGHILSAF